MKETSKGLLLAEYDRLKTLEQNRIEIYERSQQFYLTVISGATGIIVFLLGNNPPNTIPFNIFPVLGLILLLGEVTYLRLVGEDIELLELSRRYQSIRDKFIKEDASLADSFPKVLLQNPERFRSWSSFRGIIGRATTVSGVKTVVVLLNCIFTVAVLIIILWPGTIWLGLVSGMTLAALVALAHVAHAAWRYKNVTKHLSIWM